MRAQVRITIFMASAALIFTGCQTMKKMTRAVGRATGNEAMARGGAEQLAPAQEYYIGRSVAATVFGNTPLSMGDVHSYVNELGQYLALYSSRPSQFNGYRVALVKSDKALAMSAPGGYIFISEGLLRKVQNEDELAGIIAHEIAHIADRHAETNVIMPIYEAEAGMEWAKLGAAAIGQADIGAKVDLFSTIVPKIVDYIQTRAFGQKYEFQADDGAVLMLTAAGYDPRIFRDFVKNQNSLGGGALSTHPSDAQRVSRIDSGIAKIQARIRATPETVERRKARLKAMQAMLIRKG